MGLNRPIFVSFEGIDGTGKSTLIENLRVYYMGLGYHVVSTMEPGGTSVGNIARRKLAEGRNTLTPKQQALLLTISRFALNEEIIKPLMSTRDNKVIILCDRYYDSTTVYQGALGLDSKTMREFNLGWVVPDLTLLMDVPVKVAMKRMSEEDASMGYDYYAKLDKAYCSLALSNMDRFRLVTGLGGEEASLTAAIAIIKTLL